MCSFLAFMSAWLLCYLLLTSLYTMMRGLLHFFFPVHLCVGFYVFFFFFSFFVLSHDAAADCCSSLSFLFCFFSLGLRVLSFSYHGQVKEETCLSLSRLFVARAYGRHVLLVK